LGDIREDQEVQVQEAIDSGLEALKKAALEEARASDQPSLVPPHSMNVSNMTVERMLAMYDDIVERDMALEIAGDIRFTGLSSLSDSVSNGEMSSSDDEDGPSMEKVSATHKQLTALHDALDVHFGSASSTSMSSDESVSSEEPLESLVESAPALNDDIPTMPVEDLLLFYERTVAKEVALTDAAQELSDGSEPLSSPADFELVPDQPALEFKPPARSKALQSPDSVPASEINSQPGSEAGVAIQEAANTDASSDGGLSSQADRSWVLI